MPVVDAAPKPPPNTKPLSPHGCEIADVDIDVEVRPTGIAKDGSMELPETVRRAGWYRFGPTPRDRIGTTVIAAHVDTQTEGLGPFSRLATLRRGERIVVTDRAGNDHAYRVVSRRLVAATRCPSTTCSTATVSTAGAAHLRWRVRCPQRIPRQRRGDAEPDR